MAKPDELSRVERGQTGVHIAPGAVGSAARMGDVETDRALVARVRKGYNKAFDLLVRKYQHKIIGLVSRYVHDWSECEDVAQEAFIRAYRAIGAFRGDSAFYTWMYKIAVNTAMNHLVAQGRRTPAEDIDSESEV